MATFQAAQPEQQSSSQQEEPEGQARVQNNAAARRATLLAYTAGCEHSCVANNCLVRYLVTQQRQGKSPIGSLARPVVNCEHCVSTTA
jgi:hypothetical protein